MMTHVPGYVYFSVVKIVFFLNFGRWFLGHDHLDYLVRQCGPGLDGKPKNKFEKLYCNFFRTNNRPTIEQEVYHYHPVKL